MQELLVLRESRNVFVCSSLRRYVGMPAWLYIDLSPITISETNKIKQSDG